jgi:hypothetical protein
MIFGRRWKLYVLVALSGPFVVFLGVLGYYYVVFSPDDRRAHSRGDAAGRSSGFARAFEVRQGQSVSPRQLVDRLNEAQHANRAQSGQPASSRSDATRSCSCRVTATARPDGPHRLWTAVGKTETTAIDHLEIVGQKARPEQLTLDPPLITALVSSGREKRRDVPLQLIPQHMIQAVLAIEDRRFYDHVGVDPIGIASAVWDYVSGRKAYLRSGST